MSEGSTRGGQSIDVQPETAQRIDGGDRCQQSHDDDTAVQVHDVVGIGLGPFTLGLAALLDSAGSAAESPESGVDADGTDTSVDACVLEREPPRVKPVRSMNPSLEASDTVATWVDSLNPTQLPAVARNRSRPRRGPTEADGHESTETSGMTRKQYETEPHHYR
jgi:hypothetical protein